MDNKTETTPNLEDFFIGLLVITTLPITVPLGLCWAVYKCIEGLGYLLRKELS